jgi:hypothetical protein
VGPTGLPADSRDYPHGRAALTHLAAREVVLSPSASSALHSLEASPQKEAASIVRRIRALRDVLTRNCLHGEVVRGVFIPRYFVEHYGASNLFIEDLPSFWRLVYTVVHQADDRYVAVLEIADHGAYDRWFPSGKKGR